MCYFTAYQRPENLHVAPKICTDSRMGQEVEEENTFFSTLLLLMLEASFQSKQGNVRFTYLEDLKHVVLQ